MPIFLYIFVNMILFYFVIIDYYVFLCYYIVRNGCEIMDATQICGLLDADLVTFIHNIVVVIKVAVPIILVIFGMLDFAKGVMAGKEDEIKKGQQFFIKRIIAAVFVFLVITIVQLVMGVVSSDDNSFWNCADQILNGNVNKVQYSNDSDASSCKSPIQGINEEYEYCLTVSGNQICNTIFQHDCKVAASTMIWGYDSSGGLNSVISGYSCKSGLGDYDNIYKRALYSCTVDQSNNMSIDECVSKLSPFCYKNN